MKMRAFEALRGEYIRSKRDKSGSLHRLWRSIINEYGMSNFGDVTNWLESQATIDEDKLIAANGRVASLNILVRKMVTLMTLRNPEFMIDNEHPWDEAIAEVLEQAFGSVKKAIGWTPEMRKVALSGALFGTGIAKIGLSSRYVYGETPWSADPPQRSAGVSDMDKDMPYGPTTEYQDFRIRDEWPSMIWVPSVDIFYNPGARRREEVARTYHRSRRRLIDVKRDPRYDAKVRREVLGIQPSSYEDDSYLTDLGNEYLEDVAYCEVVECFDHASRMFCVFTEDGHAPLRDWTPFPLPIDSPYKYLTPIEHPETMWGIPYAMLLLNHAQAMNRLRAVLVDQISRDGKRIHLVDGANFDDQEWLDTLNTASHGQFIEYPGLKDAQRDPIQTIEFGGASSEVLRLMSIVENDQSWVSGLTDAARNQTTAGDQTATEANQRAQQQGLNAEQFIQLNEEFQEDCAASVCQVMLAEWPEEKMVKIVGPSPQLYFWVPMERRRILNNFTIKIVAGSTERLDKLTQRRQWGELLPNLITLAQYAQQDQMAVAQGMPPSPVNWNELLRMTIDMYDSTMAHKILRRNDVVDLAMRLVRQHQILPVNLSPQMAQQLRSAAEIQFNGGLPAAAQQPAGQVVQFPGQQPVPPDGMGLSNPAAPQTGGALPQTLGGNQSGRTLSEAAGV